MDTIGFSEGGLLLLINQKSNLKNQNHKSKTKNEYRKTKIRLLKAKQI
jgi:hypothetical protein